ncbi:sugar ABC transporter ATP-binding protein [Arthrobacter sp. Z4-13]
MKSVEPTSTPATLAPALEVRGISKTFGGNRALIDVDLKVRSGEIHALVGQNGSGKSTIVKILGGYHAPDAGTALVGGQPFTLGSAINAGQAGLRFVHQDLGLIEDLTVADNFHLDSAKGGWARSLSRTAERKVTGEALSNFGYDIDPSRTVASLTAAERTAVAIVRAISGDGGSPHLLILDEPTASLPNADAEIMFGALRRLAARGRSILFISHHFDEILNIADRVTILRDGRNVATRDVAGLDSAELARLMLGRTLVAGVTDGMESARSRMSDASVTLSVTALRTGSVRGINFTVRRGEILGFAGLTGSGREEVAPALAGQIDRLGAVEVNGRTIAPGKARAAISAGVQYLPSERRRDGLFLEATVRENILISDLDSVSRFKRLQRRLERAEAGRWVKALDVRPAEIEMKVSELSGGNQQKVVLGRLLRMNPTLLVLDEPTQGVDLGAKLAIHELIEKVAADGVAVVLCTSDEDELANLSHRVMVMRKGGIGAVLEGGAISRERLEEEQLSVPSIGTRNSSGWDRSA